MSEVFNCMEGKGCERCVRCAFVWPLLKMKATEGNKPPYIFFFFVCSAIFKGKPWTGSFFLDLMGTTSSSSSMSFEIMKDVCRTTICDPCRRIHVQDPGSRTREPHYSFLGLQSTLARCRKETERQIDRKPILFYLKYERRHRRSRSAIRDNRCCVV